MRLCCLVFFFFLLKVKDSAKMEGSIYLFRDVLENDSIGLIN